MTIDAVVAGTTIQAVIQRVTLARLQAERCRQLAKAFADFTNGRQVCVDLQRPLIVLAERALDAEAQFSGRFAGNEVHSASGRVTPVQCALGTTQYFHALELCDIHRRTLHFADVDAI